MYDSRDDRPVYTGTHHAGSNSRWCREMGRGDLIAWGTPRRVLLATPAAERTAIAEGLAEMAEPQPTNRRVNRTRPEAPKEATMSRTRKNRRIAAIEFDRDAPARKSAGYVPLVGIAAKKRATGKHEPRLTAEPFDPAKVSKTLSPRAAVNG